MFSNNWYVLIYPTLTFWNLQILTEREPHKFAIRNGWLRHLPVLEVLDEDQSQEWLAWRPHQNNKKNTSLPSPNNKNSTSMDILQSRSAPVRWDLVQVRLAMSLVKWSICNLDHCFTWCLRSIFGSSVRYSHSMSFQLQMAHTRNREVVLCTQQASHHGQIDRLSTGPCTPPNPRAEIDTKPLPNISTAAYLFQQTRIRSILVVQPSVLEKLKDVLEVRFHPEHPAHSTFGRWNVQNMFNDPPAHSRILRDLGGVFKNNPKHTLDPRDSTGIWLQRARAGREAKDTDSPEAAIC